MARITEIKTICIHDGSYCRPVCLEWLNSLGGWDRWVFEHDQERGIDIGSAKYFKPTFWDLSIQEGVVETFSKRGAETITLYSENIIAGNLEGFQDMLLSNKVYKLVADGLSWKRYVVHIDTGSFKLYRTKNNQFNISVRIKEGEIYSQIQ